MQGGVSIGVQVSDVVPAMRGGFYHVSHGAGYRELLLCQAFTPNQRIGRMSEPPLHVGDRVKAPALPSMASGRELAHAICNVHRGRRSMGTTVGDEPA